MTDEADMRRGQLAEDVLNNEVYVDSCDRIKQGIRQKWEDSRDRDDREHLHRLLMAVRLIESELASVMRSGKVAAKELERKRTLSERIGLRSRSA